MPLILIVEDDHDLAIIIEKYLRKERFDTQIINDGTVVVDWVKDHRPSVILLDLMLPGKDGLTICEEINEFCNIPMIITTAKVGEIDRLIGFEAGADDYICKPYSPKEVVARVKVCLRRLNGDIMVADPVTVDESKLAVKFHELSVCLTGIEFNLFRLLYDRPQQIFSRQNIIDAVYQDYKMVSFLTVNSHIRNLRKKLSQVSPDHELIQSIYSIGYRYESVLSKEFDFIFSKKIRFCTSSAFLFVTVSKRIPYDQNLPYPVNFINKYKNQWFLSKNKQLMRRVNHESILSKKITAHRNPVAG